MTRLLVELLVPNDIADAFSDHFVDVNRRFTEAGKKLGKDSVILVVWKIQDCSEAAVIKVADPYIRTWSNDLDQAIMQAWNEAISVAIGDDKADDIGKPIIFFSTGITE